MTVRDEFVSSGQFDPRRARHNRAMEAPTYHDVLAARPHVYAHMRPSPLLKHPLLDEWIGRPTWVKHENHNPRARSRFAAG